MKHSNWSNLARCTERNTARLAALARADTINGGCAALAMAKRIDAGKRRVYDFGKCVCDAVNVVSDVYGASTGKPSREFEAWECVECGTVHLGVDAASRCCALLPQCAGWSGQFSRYQHNKMTLPQILDKACHAALLSSHYIHSQSDRARFLARARRTHKRMLAEPGDCKGDFALLAGLALATAHIGYTPGCIPVVQKLGCEIAKLIKS